MQTKELYTIEEARPCLEAIQSFCVIDTETTGLSWHTDSLVCAQVRELSGDLVYYVHKEAIPVLTYLNPCVGIIGHNLKFDLHFLRKLGIILLNKTYDTMLMHHLLDENTAHDLDSIVYSEFNKDQYKEVFWSKYKSFEEAPHDEKVNYACKDAYYTGELYTRLCSRLVSSGIPSSLIEHVNRLADALRESEANGVLIDLNYLTDIGSKLKMNINLLDGKMRQSAAMAIEAIELRLYAKELSKRKTPVGKSRVKPPLFNFKSTHNVTELLYRELELPEQLNKAGSVTADDAALSKLQDKHQVVEYLREYRENTKVYDTFIEGTLHNAIDGRIFPSFNVNGTVTGRISSSHPNMQQLPRDGGVRGIFVPRPGFKFIAADYSQLEIVLAAHFSQDPVLIETIQSGKSLHDVTAEALGIARQHAKTINFSLIYGATEFRIASILGCSFGRAKKVLDTLWNTYKGLKNIIDECHNLVDEGKPIVSLFGRQRHFNTKGATHWEIQRMKRQAFNSLVQGSGGDLTSRCYYLSNEQFKKRGYGRCKFPIHDEILGEAKDEFTTEASALLVQIMEYVGREANLRLPLKAECSKPMERWEK